MTDTWTWATVTQASPLRIKVDGDTTPLDATTGDLVGSLAVDDRVRVHLHADGIIVTGLQGGGALGAWRSYSPAWTGTTTSPAIGNGTLFGQYTQIGETVIAEIWLVIGSTTSLGSGYWEITLPVAADDALGARGAGYLIDWSDSGASPRPISAYAIAPDRVRFVTPSGFLTQTTISWAASDRLAVTLTYRAATP